MIERKYDIPNPTFRQAGGIPEAQQMKIRESDIPGLGVKYEHSTVVPVHVISDDGAQARIRIEGAGVEARDGQLYTVPSEVVHEWWEEI